MVTSLWILVRKKGSKKFIGAIPARKGISRAKLQKSLRRQVKKNLSFRIVTQAQLKKMFGNVLKRALKRKVKRRVKRKVRRKRRR